MFSTSIWCTWIRVSCSWNAHDRSAVLSIRSQHMRKLYKHFLEVLLVNCAHKTNRCVHKINTFCPCLYYVSSVLTMFSSCFECVCRYNYQFCALMSMDQFDNGQTMQHSVSERNVDWSMVKVGERFQSVNGWERTKVVMVGIGLNAIEGLRGMFPDNRILLCHLHVHWVDTHCGERWQEVWNLRQRCLETDGLMCIGHGLLKVGRWAPTTCRHVQSACKSW